jgi:hypothetical protein
MNHKLLIANAVLWVAAIIASAVVGAPAILSAILLPVLAAVALLTRGSKLGKSADVVPR